MEAKAVARTIRIAPRKVRLVLDLIRGKNAGEAIAILKLTNKASSPVIEKVLMSALAYANEGPTLKRFRPRAQGRASAINKRTSHITIVVSDGKEEAKEA